MKKALTFILLLIAMPSLFCCDWGYYAAKTDIHLKDGSVINGYFLVNGEAYQVFPIGTVQLPPGSKLKNGDNIFPFSKSENLCYPLDSVYVATKYVNLPWGFYLVNDNIRSIPIDSIKSIIYQSENAPKIFNRVTSWHTISAEEYRKIENGIYSTYYVEGALCDFVLVSTNENLSKKELNLYALSYNFNWESKLNPYETFATSYSGNYQIDYSSDYVYNEYGICQSMINVLNNTYNDLEEYKVPIKNNELYADSSKAELLKRINSAQVDLKLLTAFMNMHIKQKNADISKERYMKRLLEIEQFNTKAEFANDRFLKIYTVVTNPNILKDLKLEKKKGINRDEIFHRLGIVILESNNLMGGYW